MTKFAVIEPTVGAITTADTLKPGQFFEDHDGHTGFIIKTFKGNVAVFLGDTEQPFECPVGVFDLDQIYVHKIYPPGTEICIESTV